MTTFLGIEPRGGRRVIAGIAIAETIGEDLIDDRILGPGWCIEARLIDVDVPGDVGRIVVGLAPTAIARRVIFVINHRRAVFDNKAVVEDAQVRADVKRCLPVVVAVNAGVRVGAHLRQIVDGLALKNGVPDTHLDALHVMGEGAEAQRHVAVLRQCAERITIEAAAAVMAQAIPPNVVIAQLRSRRIVDAVANLMRGVVIPKGDHHMGAFSSWHHQGDVGAAGHAARAIVLIPRFIERHLVLVGSGWYIERGLIPPVAVPIFHPTDQVIGRPVLAADRAHQVAYQHRDAVIRPAGHHVAIAAVIVKMNRFSARGGEGHVRPARHAVHAVVLIPCAANGGLELIRAGRNGVGGKLPNLVAIRVAGLGVGVAGVPIVAEAGRGYPVAGKSYQQVGRGRRRH